MTPILRLTSNTQRQDNMRALPFNVFSQQRLFAIVAMPCACTYFKVHPRCAKGTTGRLPARQDLWMVACVQRDGSESVR